MKEVSLVGATLYGNRGAEAMLSATIGELRDRYPELQFNVFSYYPAKDRELLVSEGIAIHSSTPFYLVAVLGPMALLYRLAALLGLRRVQRFFPGSVRALARSRVLICLAGVSFIDGRTKFLPFNIATILPAMLAGVPVVKFAQAMGPFRRRLNRLAARLFLARCRQVFARGDRTLCNLRETFGAKSFYQRANDVAFLFRPETSLSRCEAGIETSLAGIRQLRESKRLVGLCPSVVVARRRQAQGHDYAAEMAQLVESLLHSGHGVVLFPNATRGDDMDKEHNNDLPLLQAIQERIGTRGGDSLIIVDQSVNAAWVHKIIETCEVIVTSRFHAMVGALATATPVLVLGWSHKYLEVMCLFGQEEMVMDHADVALETMADKVGTLLNEATQRGQQIAEALPEVQRGARVQFEYLERFLATRA